MSGGNPYNPNRSYLALGLVGFGFLTLLAANRKIHQSVLLADALQTKKALMVLNKAQLEAKRTEHLTPFLASQDQQAYRRNMTSIMIATSNKLPVLEVAVREAKTREEKEEAQRNLADAQETIQLSTEALHFINQYLAEQKATTEAQFAAKIRKFQEKAKIRPPKRKVVLPEPVLEEEVVAPSRMFIETEAMREAKLRKQQQEATAAEAATKAAAASAVPNPAVGGFLPFVAPRPSSPRQPQPKASSGGPLLPF